MRILKDNDAIYCDIIDEMLNLESGYRLFINGIKQENPERYPRLTVDNIDINIIPNTGVIYITESININEFQINIKKQLIDREIIEFGESPGNHLCEYYTIMQTKMCNVKLKSDLKQTVCKTNKKENICRQFITFPNGIKILSNHYRFTWIITYLSTLEFNEYKNLDIKLSNYDNLIINVSSIVFDKDDVLNLKHMDFTTNLNLTNYKAYNNIGFIEYPILINRGNKVNIPIFNEIYKISYYQRIRQIDINKLFYIDINNIQLLPNKDKCLICYNLLFDDIYILSNDGFKGNPICAMCLHFDDTFIEEHFEYIFRTMHPRSIMEEIDSLERNEIEKDILKECLKNISFKSLYIPHQNVNIEVYYLGDKYIGITSLKLYKYISSKYINTEERKIVNIKDILDKNI